MSIKVLSKIFISAFFLIFLFGCKNQKETFQEVIDFHILMEAENVGLPLDLIVWDDTLMISDFYGDSLVHLIDLGNKEEVSQFVRKGNGPGEVLSPIKLSLLDDKVFVYSRPLFSLFEANPDSLSDLRFKTKIPYVTMNLFPLSEIQFIASYTPFKSNEDMQAKRFLLLDSEGNILSYFGEFPSFLSEEKNYEPEVLANFHQVNSLLPVSKDSFIVTGPYDISLYAKDKSGGYVLTGSTQVGEYDYDYTPASDTMGATTKIKDGSSGKILCAALYKDHVILALQADSYPISNEDIMFKIYDLKGNLVKELIPNIILQTPFGIDREGHIIALSSSDDKTNIVISDNAINI